MYMYDKRGVSTCRMQWLNLDVVPAEIPHKSTPGYSVSLHDAADGVANLGDSKPKERRRMVPEALTRHSRKTPEKDDC